MKTKDFENAIDGTGIELLQIHHQAGGGGQVTSCYGQVMGSLTYVKWDELGRAFTFTQPEGEESCISEYNLEWLPYERDPKFDLKF
mgnify:FL=1